MKNSLSASRGDIPDRPDYFGAHLPLVPAFRALIRAVECRLLAEVEMPEPVLDIGCGDGIFAQILAGGRWFAGVDTWAEGVQQARARGAYRHTLVASGARLPFADGAFCTVVSNCVLEHIPDVDGVLHESNRVLQMGGRFVFTVPSHRFADMLFGSTACRRLGLRRLARAYGDWFNRKARHYHCDPPEAWAARLAGAGFAVERWQYYLSHAALQALDVAHYYGVPSLLWRKLLGRWNVARGSWNYAVPDWWLRRYYEEPWPNPGGYIFFAATKTRELER